MLPSSVPSANLIVEAITSLDLLILHALQRGSLHGYAVAQTIHLLSDEVLRVEDGSLYPASQHETWTRLSLAVQRVLAHHP